MGINVIGGSTTTTQDKTAIYGTPGTYTFTPPAGVSPSNPLLCEVTVVGGGGGGGNYNTASAISGSGGGAGQVINQSSFYVTGPTTVTVGAGGAAQTAGGNSAFGSLVALGGLAGAGVNTPTEKRAGTDDCTKGAAGTSAFRLLGIGLQGTSSSPIFWKDPSALTTVNGHSSLSKPPLSSPQSEWSVATNGSHIIACNSYANGTSSGGNLTAFYTTSVGWTVRSVGSFSSAFYSVSNINGVAVCFPGGQADTSTYYYATNGSNNWTTANHGLTGDAGQTWTINLTAEQSEMFVIRRNSTVIRRTVDGINWTSHTLPAAPTGGVYSGVGIIARLLGQSTYVYYSAAYVSNNTNVYTSPDLTTWTQRTTPNFNTNVNAGNYGDFGIIAVGSYYWMAGSNSDGAVPNWFYSSNGYSWNGYTWETEIRQPSGSINNWGLVKNGVWYAGNSSNNSNGFSAVRYGTFFPTSFWSSPDLTQNQDYGALVEYSLPGISNSAPTTFVGITNLQPTGGSSGVPSSGGDGGNGGSYIAPTTKTTTASAAATPGQVPGSGGGGGGAGSTAGAAGAAGIVSIEYYG